MTGSWEGRGNQYIQLVKVLYCKLPTSGKQLPAFPLELRPGIRTPISEVVGESVTTANKAYIYILVESYFENIRMKSM